MPILVLLLHPCDVLHLAQTGTEILKQACCQMFCLTKSLHVCLNCKTLGNDVWAFCNLCHLPMCRPGQSMPSFHRPRMFTTTFESDWNQHRNRWNVPRLTWKPYVAPLLVPDPRYQRHPDAAFEHALCDCCHRYFEQRC